MTDLNQIIEQKNGIGWLVGCFAVASLFTFFVLLFTLLLPSSIHRIRLQCYVNFAISVFLNGYETEKPTAKTLECFETEVLIKQ